MGDFGAGGERVSMDMDTPDGKIDIEESTRVENDNVGDGGGEEGGGGGGGGGSEGVGSVEGKCMEGKEPAGAEGVTDDVNDLYSSIEIGQISGKGLIYVYFKFIIRYIRVTFSSCY